MINDALKGQQLVTFKKAALAFTIFRNNILANVQDTVNQCLEEADNRISTCETKVNTFESKVTECETKVSACETKVTECETKVNTITETAPIGCLSNDDLNSLLVDD